MLPANNTLGAVVETWRSGLLSAYDPQEIRGVINWVFEHFLGLSGARLTTDANKRLSESEIQRLTNLLERLQQGEPLQYVLGSVPFMGLILKTDARALIPRPETEELADWIISDEPSEQFLTIMDIGTGTGCLALSLKKMLVNSTVYALDRSAEALALCRENATANQLSIHTLQTDIFAEPLDLPNQLDVIVSNPPYVLESEKGSMANRVKDFEPGMALFVPDNDPLIFYRRILEVGQQWLVRGGRIYFETHYQQAEAVAVLATEQGYTSAAVRQDLNGQPRMIRCVWPG